MQKIKCKYKLPLACWNHHATHQGNKSYCLYDIDRNPWIKTELLLPPFTELSTNNARRYEHLNA